jgi:hypothetical protein
MVTILLASVSSPQFVPGEVLVKFLPGTAGSEAFTKAVQVSPPDLSFLRPVINSLENEVGVPLQIKQVSGGKWVLLSARLDAIVAEAVQQLRARESIQEARAELCEPQSHGPHPAPLGFIITFQPETAEAEAIDQELSHGDEEPLSQLILELEEYLDLPLKVKKIEKSTLHAEIGLDALTLTLVERLKAVEQIEAAQPNHILSFR